MAKLITLARNKSKASDQNITNPQTQAKLTVISSVQQCSFKEDIKKLHRGERIQKTSPLWTLTPFHRLRWTVKGGESDVSTRPPI